MYCSTIRYGSRSFSGKLLYPWNDLVRNNKGVSIWRHTRESGSQQQQPAAVAALATDVELGLKRTMNSLSRVQNNGASLH